jgi:hypothetical protein
MSLPLERIRSLKCTVLSRASDVYFALIRIAVGRLFKRFEISI